MWKSLLERSSVTNLGPVPSPESRPLPTGHCPPLHGWAPIRTRKLVNTPVLRRVADPAMGCQRL